MPRAQWQLDLAALRNRNPYCGYGGLRRLAEDLGVSYISVYKWSCGMCAPSAENRTKLEALRGAGK